MTSFTNVSLAIISLVSISFLIGSIPVGYLLAKFQKIDITQQGSGNIGATNVLRVLGKKLGIFCFLLDFLKGAIPTFLAVQLLNPLVPHYQTWQVLIATASIIGHNYTPWLKFKGGKGIATTAGILAVFMPFGLGLFLLIWAILFYTTRYVSVASLATTISLPLLTHLGARIHGKWADGTWNKPLLVFSILICCLSFWSHRSNIRRLINKTENRFKKPL